MYLGNFMVENGQSKQRRLEMRLFAISFRTTHNLPKHRTPAGNHHGHLVCPRHRIVVPKHPPCLTTFAHVFTFITCKDTTFLL